MARHCRDGAPGRRDLANWAAGRAGGCAPSVMDNHLVRSSPTPRAATSPGCSRRRPGRSAHAWTPRRVESTAGAERLPRRSIHEALDRCPPRVRGTPRHRRDLPSAARWRVGAHRERHTGDRAKAGRAGWTFACCPAPAVSRRSTPSICGIPRRTEYARDDRFALRRPARACPPRVTRARIRHLGDRCEQSASTEAALPEH